MRQWVPPLPGVGLGCLLALGLFFACSAQREEGPAAAYLRFIRAAQKGNPSAIWESLSARTRQAYEERARALSEASDGAVGSNPAALLLSPLDDRGNKPLPKVEVLSEDEGTAVIRVTDKNRSRELRMVKEQAVWRLDLAYLL